MSRSKKKFAIVTCTKKWDKDKEHAFRRKTKQALRHVEIDFDPDADWEDANVNPDEFRDWGTRFGWKVDPGPDDKWHDAYLEGLRK